MVLVISFLASHFTQTWSCAAETQSYLDTVGVKVITKTGDRNKDKIIDGNF